MATLAIASAPEVDFADHAEYLELETAFFRVMQGFLRSRIASSIRFWQRWPYMVFLNLREIGTMFLLRLTKGQGGAWCSDALGEIEEVVQETTVGVIALSRLRGAPATELELKTVVGETLTHAIAARLRTVFVKNIVFVSHPPLDFSLYTAVQGEGGSLLYSWPQIYAFRLAVAMAGHARLGAGSPLARLDEPLLRLVALEAYTPKWPFFEP
jgi:hypothetical protein